ncbi:hypothetical protein N307_10010, partial [Dryobates pubescens]
VLTLTEVEHKQVAVQASRCRKCWSLALQMQGSGDYSCIRCEQIDYLLNLVARLKDEVARLRAVRECRKEMNQSRKELNQSKQALQAPPAEAGSIRESERESDMWEKALQISPAEGSAPGNREAWIQVPARGSKENPSRPSPPLPLPLHNKYEALQAESSGDERAKEQPSEEMPKAKQSPPTITTSSTKKKRSVIVVGDSLLRGTEGPICCPDPSHREVYSLPGARVRNITRRLPKLILTSDYYPLLVIQAGSDEIDKKGTRVIKKEFTALGQLIDGAGAPMVFCSVPSVAGVYTERNRRNHIINNWHKGWCQQRNFGFFDHGATFTAPHLLGPDGVQLSRKGKRVLALELAGLIKRDLN